MLWRKPLLHVECKLLGDGHTKGLFAARDGDTSTRQLAVFWKLMTRFAQYHESGFAGVWKQPFPGEVLIELV